LDIYKCNVSRAFCERRVSRSANSSIPGTYLVSEKYKNDTLTNSTGAGWTVPYVPGSIEAIAYNNKNITIANRTIITTGDPTSVGLSLDTDATIRADGQDVALVAVAILDAKVFISFPLIATY
jgi:hypothetical protein